MYCASPKYDLNCTISIFSPIEKHAYCGLIYKRTVIKAQVSYFIKNIHYAQKSNMLRVFYNVLSAGEKTVRKL